MKNYNLSNIKPFSYLKTDKKTQFKCNLTFLALYTQKTPSYYIQCFCIFASLVIFGLFNLWQLNVSLHYFDYLDVVARTDTNSRQTQMTNIPEKKEPIVLVVNRNLSENMQENNDYRLVM